MSAMSVLISAGAVLGKANLVQLLLMVLIEVTTFGATRTLDKQVLLVSGGSVSKGEEVERVASIW